MMHLGEGVVALVDWHVSEVGSAIDRKRREGWSDAQIKAWLLSPENRSRTNALGPCPLGCNEELVKAAFWYMRTGDLPSGRSLGPAPGTGLSTAMKIGVGVGVGLVGLVAFAALSR